jgi:acetylornithine deacetylase
MDACISLLQQLVAIESVNPSLATGAPGEGEIAAFLDTHMTAIGLEVHLQEAAPGRPNVIGVFDSGRPGPSLMLCGHIDTVGVDGYEHPFEPVIRDGRLYGRGSQDMKGGVAAMLDAVRVVRERGLAAGRVIVAAVVDEEFASLGADQLVTAWRADAAVVTEPTDLQVGVAHKGFAWFEIETRGRAAHGSRPADGRDAIMRMGRVLARLEAMDRELQDRPPHPLIGTASLHASTISGGHEWSSYPDACLLRLERRTVMGESAGEVERELRGLLAGLAGLDAEFEAEVRAMFARPPYEVPEGHPLTDVLLACAAARGIESRPVGMSFWTDAAVLGGAGIPSLLFGPGGAGLHSTEEYVTIADVIACRDVLADLIVRWCVTPTS